MLVLTRKTGEAIELSRSDDGEVIATIVVTDTSKGAVKLGVNASKSTKIMRTEIKQPQEEAE